MGFVQGEGLELVNASSNISYDDNILYGENGHFSDLKDNLNCKSYE